MLFIISTDNVTDTTKVTISKDKWCTKWNIPVLLLQNSILEYYLTS